MGNKTLMQKLILDILSSDFIDVRIALRNQVVILFRDCKFVAGTPVAIRMNTALDLKESIDNYITHDNASTREALKNSYTIMNQLLCEDVKIAG